MLITASHTKHHNAKQLIQHFLTKSMRGHRKSSLNKHRQNYNHTFTPDPTAYRTTLSLKQTIKHYYNKTHKNSWNHS